VLRTLIEEGGTDAEQFLNWLRGRLPQLKTLSDLPVVEYARAKQALGDRNVKIRAKNGGDHAAAD
jgi:hypothetical protein